MNNETVLDLNVRWALDQGMAVIPCEERGKNWLNITPLFEFDEWLSAKDAWGPNINAAIHLNGSNLACFDIDSGMEGLLTALHVLCCPETLMFQSARGWHMLYERPGNDVEVVGSAGRIFVGEKLIGNYFCGNALNHYVMLPGSIHPSGFIYRPWNIAAPVMLPHSLLDHLNPWRT